jgi:hypothetical protein
MRFSSAFVQVAEFHHWNTYDKDTDRELLILCLADHLAYEMGFGFLGSEDHHLPVKVKEKSSEEGQEPDTGREEALDRIKNLSALKLLGMTPEAVYAIGEQIRPMIIESAGAF